MGLTFQRRRTGDITILQCSGRIVQGAESSALQLQLNELLPDNRYIVLHLGDVEFIDSSGLGLLVRCLTWAENARGGLKLCAVSRKISNALRVTKLKTIFEMYETEEEAVAAFYRPSKAANALVLTANILCVDESADVLAYLRELLRQAGYHVTATDNVSDALALLTATRPRLVVVGATVREVRHTRAGDLFNQLAEDVGIVELPSDFSTHDAEEAGQDLVQRVNRLLGAAKKSAATV